MIPRLCADFDIAIICALPVEFDAVEALFDQRYDDTAYEKHHGDANFYRTGKIHQHNVVLACLPEMGKRSAASVASSLQCTFANIYLTLLVGICGGVPYPLGKTGDTELILGDVIISPSIVENDFGKQYPDKFQPRDSVIDITGRDRRIRTLLAALRTSRFENEFQERLSSYLMNLRNSDLKWDYPGAEHDKLFEADYRHKHHASSSENKCICGTCESSRDPVCDEALESDCSKLGCNGALVNRDRLSSCDLSPQIHIGALGSGDTVMKSGEHRDKLAKAAKIMGFEMEGAGVCDNLRCIIIKGISDYADSHKSKMWQQYAAATAASCCKAFLEILPKSPQKSPPLFIEDRVTAFEVGVNGSSNPVNSASPSEPRLTSLDGSSDGHQDGYRWDLTSITSDIDDMEHHLNALEKELHRIKSNIENPLVKSVLISGVTQAVQSNSQTLRSSQGMESFQVSYYDTSFGRIISRTRIDRNTMRAVEDGEICTHYRTTTSFIFHPASRLIRMGLKSGLEAMTTSSRAGWRYNIVPVRSIPDDALVFEFCSQGNVDAVRELFQRGDASVLDVDSDGWMPLPFAAHYGHLDLVKFLLLQGADKAASGYDNTTPAALISSKGEAIELLRLFDDCIDLSEPDSQGWEIFETITYSWGDFEVNVAHGVLSFFLQKYRIETLDSYYEAPIRHALWTSINILLDAKSLHLLLEFDPQTHSVDSAFPSYYYPSRPLVFDIVAAPHTTTDILRYLMEKGANIHRVDDGATPTSMALRLSHQFLPWRDRLWAIYQNLDEFITSNNPTTSILKESGWHPETLHIIFSLGFNEARTHTRESVSGFYDSIHCKRHCYSWIEPWWEALKYRVKTHQCISSMLENAGMHLDKKYFGELSSEPKVCYDSEDGDIVRKVPAYKHLAYLSRAEYKFYRRGGNWRFHYEPGEVWCLECLIERESIDEASSESSDTESSDEDVDMESSDNGEEEEEEEEDDYASDISLD
ncbi:hypothetical protein PMAA_069170 [Talaromyces marneffei ATCC 18224]|uniref:Nucleoside phosphorylase domain-containing protein n=1 Tax=Talaromyces marneffei (strain ATCC 18224 / CBS 334.59 / QM 7333) TaxID=441960 RepID=B6Q8M0_TALMQ|nr:hypothetical protein PMAA_069170 [Talaromyces marneffei ATCC 18224]